MKKFLPLAPLFIVMLLWPTVCSAKSFTASYKIRVVIPAVVGLNVPSKIVSEETKSENWITTTEKIKSGEGFVMCETTVVK